MGTSQSFLSLESDGAVVRLTLRRPPLNILHLEMVEELRGALREIAADGPTRVLVLAAEGKAFSAGVAVEDHLPARVGRMLPAFHAVFLELRALALPTIARVQGPALGGGCELACFADWVIASEEARFGLPEITLACYPPVAAIHFPQRIGLARTRQLVFSGAVLSAREAFGIGLVDKVVPAAALDEATEGVVRTLLEKSAPALRLAKRATEVGSGQDFAAGLQAAERLFLEELMKTEDATEGLQAFLEKRAPAWRHR